MPLLKLGIPRDRADMQDVPVSASAVSESTVGVAPRACSYIPINPTAVADDGSAATDSLMSLAPAPHGD